MSYESVFRIRVNAPAGFARRFMLDVRNWPRVEKAIVEHTLHWEGPPWRPHSALAFRTRALGPAMTVRYRVLPAPAGEIFRLGGGWAGTSTLLGCSVEAFGPHTCIITAAAAADGWTSPFARFTPQPMTDQMQWFSSPAIAREIEMYWLRSAPPEGDGPAMPRGTAAFSQPAGTVHGGHVPSSTVAPVFWGLLLVVAAMAVISLVGLIAMAQYFQDMGW